MATAEQVQELVEAVQSLNMEVQNLNQEMQNLKMENTVFRQLVANREPRSTDLPPMPLSSGKFDGTSKHLKEFIEACNIQFAFSHTTYSTDFSKVGFVISNLTGNALAWANPLVTADESVLRDWRAFLEKFKQVFERTEIKYMACEELLEVHQGQMDPLSYITKFKLRRDCVLRRIPYL
ncbi:protein LDOC1-like [Ambystoma mexicanum]|uniref:protein LDOC1-like n=1 Tax=Ambystoma mexicanum TaxID=8296 RepID=UPI0037E98DE4